MDIEKYYTGEWARVSNNYTKSKHKGFKDKNDLADWFVEQLKEYNCKCYYCNTSIHDIKRLIDSKILKERKTGYGTRGPHLEIDKNDDSYTKEHCVLSCYYCNNDKSYTTSKEDYKKHFGENRKMYFEFLLQI